MELDLNAARDLSRALGFQHFLVILLGVPGQGKVVDGRAGFQQERIEDRRLASTVRTDEYHKPRGSGHVTYEEFGESFVVLQVYIFYSHATILCAICRRADSSHRSQVLPRGILQNNLFMLAGYVDRKTLSNHTGTPTCAQLAPVSPIWLPKPRSQSESIISASNSSRVLLRECSRATRSICCFPVRLHAHRSLRVDSDRATGFGSSPPPHFERIRHVAKIRTSCCVKRLHPLHRAETSNSYKSFFEFRFLIARHRTSRKPKR